MGISHAAPRNQYEKTVFPERAVTFRENPRSILLPQKSAGSAVSAALPTSAEEGLRRAPSNSG